MVQYWTLNRALVNIRDCTLLLPQFSELPVSAEARSFL